MKTILTAVAMVVTLAPAWALACDGEQEVSTPPEIQKLDVQRLAELQKKAAIKIYDANTQKTRTEQGIIPGATMLTSASQYDVAKELTPTKNTPIVFYCANEMCRASHVAAERAVGAGYTNVSVLPAGIIGWKAAGQKVSKPNT